MFCEVRVHRDLLHGLPIKIKKSCELEVRCVHVLGAVSSQSLWCICLLKYLRFNLVLPVDIMLLFLKNIFSE